MRALAPLEARVLGVLVEKQKTVPDTYPLSLNALAAGCNQKTARDPVMNASDADVLAAIDGLEALSLVIESSGSRVVRYEHNLGRVLGVPSQSAALLSVLMLRGAQTAAELRQGAERQHRFADVSSVEGFLDELAAHAPPLVVRLPRAAGAREARWMHLLSGEPVMPEPRTGGEGKAAMPASADAAELAALRAEQSRLASEFESLRRIVERMAAEIGLRPENAEKP